MLLLLQPTQNLIPLLHPILTCSHGAYSLWPPSRKVFHPGRVHVNFGDPIAINRSELLGDRTDSNIKQGQHSPLLRDYTRSLVRSKMLEMISSGYPKHAGSSLWTLGPLKQLIFFLHYCSLVLCLFFITRSANNLAMMYLSTWSMLEIASVTVVLSLIIDIFIYIIC